MTGHPRGQEGTVGRPAQHNVFTKCYAPWHLLAKEKSASVALYLYVWALWYFPIAMQARLRSRALCRKGHGTQLVDLKT